MRTYRELIRRVQALEVTHGEPLVVLVRSFVDMPTSIRGPAGATWARLPGESTAQMRERAFADVSQSGLGMYVLRELPRGDAMTLGGL